MPRIRTDSFRRRHWVIPEPHECAPIPNTPYPDFLTRLLRRRGVEDDAGARRFLADAPTPLSDVATLPGAPEAVERIARAVRGGESIAVYGDFDVDGVTSTAMLTEVIRAVGGTVTPYIPDRFTEGYGLNTEALARLRRDQGVTLVVTADCGMTSIREIAVARDAGQEVVILDHHSVPDSLPDACVTVNPKLPGSRYGFPDLSTGGVAYRLARPLLDHFGKAVDEEQWADLAALSTVADVVPLRGENRWIVRTGLAVMARTTRPGLRALMDVAGLGDGPLDADDIAFALAPRLNAAGRLDHARHALHILMERDADRARALAERLDRLNLQRRQLTLDAMERAAARLTDEDPTAPLTFLGDAEIPAGIVGLVAGRLAEDRHRPSFVYEEGPEFSRASCRSIPEFDIAAALRHCDDLLIRHGGHAMAAGFTARTADLPALKERLTALASEQLRDVELHARLEVDAQVPLERVGPAQVTWLQRLGPFGAGNPAPMFVSTNLAVRDARRVGSDDAHLRLTLRGGGRNWPAIGFGLGAASCRAGDRVDAVWALKRDSYRGSVELEIKDLAPAGG